MCIEVAGIVELEEPVKAWKIIVGQAGAYQPTTLHKHYTGPFWGIGITADKWMVNKPDPKSWPKGEICPLGFNVFPRLHDAESYFSSHMGTYEGWVLVSCKVKGTVKVGYQDSPGKGLGCSALVAWAVEKIYFSSLELDLSCLVKTKPVYTEERYGATAYTAGKIP